MKTANAGAPKLAGAKGKSDAVSLLKADHRKAEQLFTQSYQATLDYYRSLVERTGELPRSEVAQAPAVVGGLNLANDNLDTGQPTRLGEYPLADKTYAKLLDESSDRGFRTVPPALREDILAFYAAPHPTVAAN